MEQTARDFVVGKTHELIGAATCCSELRAAAQRWLDALGTETEAAETKAYMDELAEDIVTIDGLIDFAQSAEGKAYFGADTAAGIAAHAAEIKASGAKYCDCPACAAAAAILENRDRLI
ncbi:MAG: molecular chaperone Hsp90 [Clostridia bacterium]|nr:molecular chaperone Hsp90 [Clostridia bacterium]